MHTITKRREIAREHVDRRLRRRLQIFIGIIVVILGVVGYRIYMGDISLVLVGGGLVLGCGVGVVAGRMLKITWNAETSKVVSRLDRMGAMLLVLYVGVEMGRTWLFGYWLQGAQLSAFGLVFVAGLLLGRFLTMRQNIMKVLVQEKKL